MSEERTPETDEAFHSGGLRTEHQARDFARRLEIQRDALREALKPFANLRDHSAPRGISGTIWPELLRKAKAALKQAQP